MRRAPRQLVLGERGLDYKYFEVILVDPQHAAIVAAEMNWICNPSTSTGSSGDSQARARSTAASGPRATSGTRGGHPSAPSSRRTTRSGSEGTGKRGNGNPDPPRRGGRRRRRGRSRRRSRPAAPRTRRGCDTYRKPNLCAGSVKGTPSHPMERSTRRTRGSSFPLSLPRVEGLPRPSCPAPPSSLSSSSPSFSLLLLDSQSNFYSVFWFGSAVTDPTQNQGVPSWRN